MTDIFIEKLGAVSLRNGVVRVETLATGADGTDRTTGELVIPATQFGLVAGGLQNAGQQLRAKLDEARAAAENADEAEGN
ncbi:MAG: hypothetical protein ACQERR_09825 [Pseudomonadota bacterium]